MKITMIIHEQGFFCKDQNVNEQRRYPL